MTPQTSDSINANESILKKQFSSCHCVLMAAYHGDRVNYLESAISSVLTPEIDRVLVGVDGTIGEDMAELLDRVAAVESRVEVIYFPHSRGLAKVLNDLIEIALTDPSCDIVFRMDADDISEPERFASQISFLQKHPEVGVLGGSARLIDGDGVFFGHLIKPDHDKILKRRLSLDSPFVHPSVAIRSSLLRSGYRYPTNTIRFEDVALWAELALAGVRFANLTTPIIRYRSTLASTSRRIGWKKVINETYIRIRYQVLTNPMRIDILSTILFIALAKLIAPPRFLASLSALRTRLFAPT